MVCPKKILFLFIHSHSSVSCNHPSFHIEVFWLHMSDCLENQNFENNFCCRFYVYNHHDANHRAVDYRHDVYNRVADYYCVADNRHVGELRVGEPGFGEVGFGELRVGDYRDIFRFDNVDVDRGELRFADQECGTCKAPFPQKGAKEQFVEEDSKKNAREFLGPIFAIRPKLQFPCHQT